MQPGTAWPPTPGVATAPITVDGVADRYDVIVVGAGAGGGVAACVLAEAGHSVLLVERGEALTLADLPRDHLRNARVFTGLQRQIDPPMAGNPRFHGEDLLLPGDLLWHNNAMTVGGGTRVYGAQAWRFCPEDFRMRSTYGEPFVDWPLTYEDLEPYYDRVEWEMGVCGPEGLRPHDGPRRRGYPMPPVSANAAQPVLERGANELGIATAEVPLLINSIPYGGRPACIQCGTCVGFACHADAKNGSDNTFIMRAIATGRCQLLTGTAGQRLVTDGSGAVVGVTLAGETWRRTISARHVVVAAGAIESARLLLASDIGTAHDQVGRYLQGHLYAGAVGVFDEVVQDCKGPGPSISTTDYRHRNDGVLGGAILVNEFVPIPVEAWSRLSAFDVVPAWGKAGLEAMRQVYSHVAFVVGPVQEVPLPTSRVTLEPRVKDRYGIPAVRLLGSGPHDEDLRAAEFMVERGQDWLRASGAKRLHPVRLILPKWPSGGQHQAGTCRMGLDPRTSVTDPWGRVWGHPGVTIADGSLHVTNGGVNPVLTILALSMKVSEHLAEELG
ncbi:MAG: glucose-methanol-choline oxidoreductase [Candidatus Nephthysia bennettiae]|uniref:GMC family oxidoreductase n=2 Tax=Candidatus Nephthysia bennettiae TaxID=3127016 RepID=A0A934K8C8_9BACT|nr:GMC family oxidoreductase [Candidatus Dormibacteraeota bacterium]MBJ7611843.1 GMC family oxidoreductase [Candidatus Dormibacteraeota bacterium]PZR89004.1 MAG: glucose-methanol-choline oxidoreductase [Candidatus Dormibacteraeota bacterium]